GQPNTRLLSGIDELVHPIMRWYWQIKGDLSRVSGKSRRNILCSTPVQVRPHPCRIHMQQIVSGNRAERKRTKDKKVSRTPKNVREGCSDEIGYAQPNRSTLEGLIAGHAEPSEAHESDCDKRELCGRTQQQCVATRHGNQ